MTSAAELIAGLTEGKMATIKVVTKALLAKHPPYKYGKKGNFILFHYHTSAKATRAEKWLHKFLDDWEEQNRQGDMLTFETHKDFDDDGWVLEVSRF